MGKCFRGDGFRERQLGKSVLTGTRTTVLCRALAFAAADSVTASPAAVAIARSCIVEDGVAAAVAQGDPAVAPAVAVATPAVAASASSHARDVAVTTWGGERGSFCGSGHDRAGG